MQTSFVELFVFRIHKFYHFDFAGRYQNGKHSPSELRLIFNKPLTS